MTIPAPRQFVRTTFRTIAKNSTFHSRTIGTKTKPDISYKRHFVQNLNQSEVKKRGKTLYICTKCRVSFLYKMTGFIFVRNVEFYFCTKCLVSFLYEISRVRNVVGTNCRAPTIAAMIFHAKYSWN